ncbi:hypothetical protein QYF36_009356 [Acer negundo]|nr:hypothetical protein QYF36_009356 [Acer negundo]
MERIESWNSEGGQQEAEKVVVHDSFKDLRGLMDGDEILNESDLIQIPIELAKNIEVKIARVIEKGVGAGGYDDLNR